MKSKQIQLKDRGQTSDDIIIQFQDCSKEQLIAHFDEQPIVRTACIYWLSIKYHNDQDFTDLLLKQLQKETALYTKIEIQNHLSLYGDVVKMCSYLGCIGKNQYKDIPLKVSLKKSYPLPRDIIARSLAHMNDSHFDDFIKCLPILSYQQLLEAVDALGFFCFYHQEKATDELYQTIKNWIHIYQDNDLMFWKLITTLSAFPQSIDLLEKIKSNQKHPTILKEAERSLYLILERYNHLKKYHSS